ncbi:MAG: hypothetical protein HY301_15525 [Verrucomicrobia bacterium]|nr:hypothetical protein [Verrucomicrobiota bacterium]
MKVESNGGDGHQKKKKRRKGASKHKFAGSSQANYPRHPLERALRIPAAILEQNAGKECSEAESAKFSGVGYNGPFRLEISSSLKFGLLERPAPGRLQITELGRKILRPKQPQDELAGKRESAIKAPYIGEVYNHYRGENLPDKRFFENALTDSFHIPQDKIDDFTAVFHSTLEFAQLSEKNGDKIRILDVSHEPGAAASDSNRIERLGKEVAVSATDTCFVMMPFAGPLGSYYEKIYDPAIRKAGLTPVRADAEIFGTGKIIDQIWRGITAAKVLVTELTSRNPNVFYELGLAHALGKPVVLVSSNELDVPFDLKHIRVIYYDVNDPFWGNKLMEKVAENILSAIRNPEETLFRRVVEGNTKA